MNGNVKVPHLPVWKRNATAEERFMELAHMARNRPELFTKFVVVYVEETESGLITNKIRHGCTTLEELGILHVAMDEVLQR